MVGASAALQSGKWLQEVNIVIRSSYTGSVCLLSIVRLQHASAQLFEQYRCDRRVKSALQRTSGS
jgi:hypothetical protein